MGVHKKTKKSNIQRKSSKSPSDSPASSKFLRVSPEMDECIKEEDVQVPSTSKDEDVPDVTRYRLNRSLSLRSVEQDPIKEETNSKKRKNPPSPKGTMSVKETTSKFDQLASKYKSQRNLKDTNKEKSKFKRNTKNTPVEKVEDPITKMLKKIMADISEIKSDVKGNNNKIDDLTTKVESIETKSKEAEELNTNALKEMKEDLANVEQSVTSKLMKEIEPTLGLMKNEIQDNVNSNMRRLIQEEMALQKHAEAKD